MKQSNKVITAAAAIAAAAGLAIAGASLASAESRAPPGGDSGTYGGDVRARARAAGRDARRRSGRRTPAGDCTPARRR